MAYTSPKSWRSTTWGSRKAFAESARGMFLASRRWVLVCLVLPGNGFSSVRTIRTLW
jgi:hypothetical protein